MSIAVHVHTSPTFSGRSAFRRACFSFIPTKLPNFVALDAAAIEIAQVPIQILLAGSLMPS